MTADPFNLQRFLDAQRQSYDTALAELKDGHKRSHWIWYIYPQLRGLGQSEMSYRYGVSGMPEADAYLAHPILGPRLAQCVEAILGHSGRSAESILGSIDAKKLHSCLTLFSMATGSMPCFDEALRQFFSGAPDSVTLEMLRRLPDAASSNQNSTMRGSRRP